MRKKELQQKAKERKEKLDQDTNLKLNRDQTIINVCQIIYKHIEAAENYIEMPTQAALLFHEHNFIGHEWNIQTTSGYSSTMPLFLYVLEEIPYEEKPCSEDILIKFMRRIFEKMQLANECIIVTLIYLEKVMINGGIEMRLCNWKPLLFTAILLASKFWEDINFWNVDYVDGLGLYPLKSINRMESEFVSLCEYNLFVSADLYTQYFLAVREISSQLNLNQQPSQISVAEVVIVDQKKKATPVENKAGNGSIIGGITSRNNSEMLAIPDQDNSYKTNGNAPAASRNSLGYKGPLGAPLISPSFHKKQLGVMAS